MPDSFDMSHYAVQDSPIIDRRRDAMEQQDALREARDDIGAALIALRRADELRLGHNRDHYLGQAVDALYRAGLAAYAGQVEGAMGFGGDLSKVMAALQAMLDLRIIGDVRQMMGGGEWLKQDRYRSFWQKLA